MFTKIRNYVLLILGILMAVGEPVMAQTGVGDPPEIEVALPFDAAALVASVLALAVTVIILVAGPRISLQFGMTAIRKIGGILR
jgi:hypothetical protein